LKQRKEIRDSDYEYILNFELKPKYKNIYRNTKAKVFEVDLSEPDLNIAKRFLNVVQKSVDYQIPNYWDWLPVTEEGIEKARQQLSEGGISDGDFIIGLHPSFSGSKKSVFSGKKKEYLREWPPEYFASLAKLIYKFAQNNNISIKILMDLLPEERELGESIVKMSGGVISLFTNPPNFERYKATIKRMNLLITPNTGPMHIAAAVNTNIVALFVDWDPSDCGPYMENDHYEVLRAEDYMTNEKGLIAIKPEIVLETCKKFMPGTDIK
jgi:ADP-heptose:LPS heptosyltransferase